MLYWLLVPLRTDFFLFNVFRYITVRTAAAGITALILSFLVGPRLIRLLERRQIGQEIREDGPKTHFAKKGTPSMGGLLIILCTVVPTLLWGNLGDTYVWVAILAMVFFGLRRYLLGAVTSIAVTLALFVTFRYAFQVLLPVVGLFDLI